MKTDIFQIPNRVISFSKEEYNKCADFADAVTPTMSSYVSKRGQSQEEKKNEDNLICKLGEICVYKYLIGTPGNPQLCTYPDFTVTEHNKSFDSDLKLISGQRVHVKSQSVSSMRSFGSSWMFQYADEAGNKKGHYDKEIFDNPESIDLCILCTVYPADNYSIINAVVSLNLLHKHTLFDAPVKSELRVSKKSVYFSSLLDIYWKNYDPKLKTGTILQ